MSTSTRDFSHLDKLSTEELQEILRQDSLLDDDSSDIDTILAAVKTENLLKLRVQKRVQPRQHRGHNRRHSLFG